MRKKIRNYFKKAVVGWISLMAVVMFTAETSVKVYGAESSVIEEVSITLKAEFGEQEEIPEPEITITQGSCYVEDVQYRTDYEKWKPGKKVRIEITLTAEDGKVFPTSLNRSQCKVTGADFVSAKALEGDRMQVKVDYRPITVLGNTELAGWSSSGNNRAVWKAVEFAPGYSVVLYGDNKVVKRLTVGSATVDLSEYMKDEEKTYYYEVKAIPVSSEDKKYMKEGEFIASSEQEFDWEEVGSATEDGGAIKGNNYVLPDGRQEVNTWKKISDQWYYFGQDGSMVKGWNNIGGFWYYMDEKGVMQTGWVNPSGDLWSYLSPNGDMCTGWVQPQPGTWYYLDSSGYMQREWVIVDGKHYYLGLDGKMKIGWNNIGGVWYFFNGDGSMAVDTIIDGWSIGANGVALR